MREEVAIVGNKRNDKPQPEREKNASAIRDWWLDEEDYEEDLSVFDLDEAEDYARDRPHLTGEPMVTGYEALERHRGVRRPRRKLTRREKRAWKKAQKYEAKLHKAQEKEDKKRERQEEKQKARKEKAAEKLKKKASKKKSTTSSVTSSKARADTKKKSVKKADGKRKGTSPFLIGRWEKMGSAVWKMVIILRRSVFMILTTS